MKLGRRWVENGEEATRIMTKENGPRKRKRTDRGQRLGGRAVEGYRVKMRKCCKGGRTIAMLKYEEGKIKGWKGGRGGQNEERCETGGLMREMLRIQKI